MQRKFALLLMGLGVLSAVIAARGVSNPGYMDADYYYVMGVQWSQGNGGEEPFIWNFLSDPKSIPTISHAYWSPLTSMLIGLCLRVFGVSFRSAQIAFIAATSLLPFLVWRISLLLDLDQRQALMAGLLALAPGFFLPFFVTTDVFSVYALIGALLMLTLLRTRARPNAFQWMISGLLCGFAHLGRADGFLLLLLPAAFIWRDRTKRLKRTGLVIAGYLFVMFPWFYRNLVVLGSLLSPGAGRTLWLLAYEEFFQFPAGVLTFERWWGAGLDQILLHRWGALKVILQRLMAENGLVFMAPFMLIGLARRWGETLVRSVTLYLSALLVLMVIVFPFAGARGGWFHSSAAAMPMLWVMVPVGLRSGVEWLGQRRRWDIERAYRVFSAATVGLAILLSWVLYILRVPALGQANRGWNVASDQYAIVGRAILDVDRAPGVIAINNPPGLYHISGLRAVVIPNGGLQELKDVVDDFDVSWVVLDENHPSGLEQLYQLAGIPAWLELERTLEPPGGLIRLFRVVGR